MLNTRCSLMLMMLCGLIWSGPIGCQQDQPATKKTMTSLSSDTPTHTIEGTIKEINLQNINKARGHYTYNVTLTIEPASISPKIDPMPKAVLVRVDKLYWGRASESQKAALAPDGPKSKLSVKTYDAYTTGMTAKLPTRITSMGERPLGWIVK